MTEENNDIIVEEEVQLPPKNIQVLFDCETGMSYTIDLDEQEVKIQELLAEAEANSQNNQEEVNTEEENA